MRLLLQDTYAQCKVAAAKFGEPAQIFYGKTVGDDITKALFLYPHTGLYVYMVPSPAPTETVFLTDFPNATQCDWDAAY